MAAGATARRHAALALVHRERESWEAVLAEIGETRTPEPGPNGEQNFGGWNVKDLAAHLTA